MQPTQNKQLILLALFLATTLVAGGCQLKFDASGASFKCKTDADCSNGFVCSNPLPPSGVQVCIDKNKLNAVPDTNTGSDQLDANQDDQSPSDSADVGSQDLLPADKSVEDQIQTGDSSKEDLAPPADLLTDSPIGQDLDGPDLTVEEDLTPPDDGVVTVDAVTGDVIQPVDVGSVDSVDPACGNVITCQNLPCGGVSPPSLLGNWAPTSATAPVHSLPQSTYCISGAPFAYTYDLFVQGSVVVQKGDQDVATLTADLQFGYCFGGPNSNKSGTFDLKISGQLIFNNGSYLIHETNGQRKIPLLCLQLGSDSPLEIRVKLSSLISNPGINDDLYQYLVLTLTLLKTN